MKNDTTKAFVAYMNRMQADHPEAYAKLDLTGIIELYEVFKGSWQQMSTEDKENFWSLPDPQPIDFNKRFRFPGRA